MVKDIQPTQLRYFYQTVTPQTHTKDLDAQPVL